MVRNLCFSVLGGIILTSFASIYFSQAGIEFEGVSALGLLPIAAYFTLIFFLFRASWFPSFPKTTRALLAWASLSGLYVLYFLCTGTADVSLLARFSAYLVLPLSAYLLRPTWPDRLCLTDVLVILCIWLPIDFGLLQEAWSWPKNLAKNIYAIPFAMCVCLLSFREIRGLNGMKWSLSFNRRDGVLVFKSLASFLAIALPLGAITGFVSWSPRTTDPLSLLGTLVGTFFLVALPEELLFRGVLQNFLQRTFAKPILGLWVASVIFGLSHLNNGPSPDWRYAVLATIAGLFYGKTFNGGTSILPAVMVHTLVDVIWIQFFYQKY